MPKWIGNAAVGLVCTARRHGTPPLQRHAAVPVFVGDGQRRRELVLHGEPVRASDSTCYTIYRMCRGYVPCACACVCVPGSLGPDSARLRERSLLLRARANTSSSARVPVRLARGGRHAGVRLRLRFVVVTSRCYVSARRGKLACAPDGRSNFTPSFFAGLVEQPAIILLRITRWGSIKKKEQIRKS